MKHIIFIALLFFVNIQNASAFTRNYFTIHHSAVRNIFAPQLNTTSLISSQKNNDFVIGKDIVETVLNGLSTGTTSIKDIVYNYYASGNIESTCSVFVQDSGATPIYTAVNPSIGTINSVGSTTYVSSGTAYFNARIGRRTKSVPCTFYRTNNVTSYAFNGTAVSTSTIKNMKDQIDTRILGKTPSATTYDIYSARNDSTHTYTRNVNMFAADVDLTCIPVLSGAINSSQTMGILVAPDIMIQANHSHPSGTMYFVKNDNTTVSRNIISGTRIGTTDIWVAKLDSDVPAGITPCKVFSSTAFTNSISPTALSYIQPPLIFTNQFRTLRIGNLIYNTEFPTMIYTFQKTGDYHDWYSIAVGGDSGSPLLALVNNQAVLLGLWYGNTSVPNVSSYITQINTAMASLGSVNSLSTVDLSGFQTF